MNPNDPAFPQPPYWMQSEKRWRNCADSGMPIRLYIATQVLQALILKGGMNDAAFAPLSPNPNYTHLALAYADALIEQEKKH